MANQQNKWNREIEELSKRRYKQLDYKLYNYYKDALKALKIEVKDYVERYEELSFSQRLQVERKLDVTKRIDEILTGLSGKEVRTVEEFARDELQLGYNSVWYTVEGMANIQLAFDLLPEDYIRELVYTKIDGRTFSERLYDYRDHLAEQATNALLEGAIKGEGYAKIAKRIGELTEANYKQALRIARTEGGRTQSTAKQKAYEEAERKGVEIEKRWMSTLDKKTRDTHRDLDGQTVAIDEYFVSKDGNRAKGPRLFGVAYEDIHCRCTTITVVNGVSPSTRLDHATGKVIDYVNYSEWEKARL